MTESNPRVAVAWEHNAAEMDKSVERTLATMEEPYFYEVWPLGLRMEGRENARKFYQRLFEMPFDSELEWIGSYDSEDALVMEFAVTLPSPGGGEQRHHVVAVSAIGPEGRVMGERNYADEGFIRFVFGELLDTEFRPVEL
jgi:hypothetical protein